MTAICFNCGSYKPAPLAACASCQAMPQTDNDAAVSLLLTSKHMSHEDLMSSANDIHLGKRHQLPPDMQSALLGSIGGNAAPPPPPAPPPPRNRGWIGWAIAAFAVAVLFLFLHPWPHFQWASTLDTVPAYQHFLHRFKQSQYSGPARERIRILREDEVWSFALRTGLIRSFREYVRVYPDGKHLDVARAKVTAMADAVWAPMAESRSEEDIQRFLREYPETSMTAAAKARIQELHDDLGWVKEQNRLEYFQAFLAKFPTHPERDWVEKRIIDLEVQAIAAGEHGELPPAEAVSVGGPEYHAVAENATPYVLTVRYSGKASKKLVIPVGATGSVSLPPGTYQVAASVDAEDVTNYYGEAKLEGGNYAMVYYIRTGSRLPIKLPRNPPARR